MPIIEGGLGTPYQSAGVPAAGTSEVQTITFAGTITGGTFTLTFEGHTTGAITWTSTDATLVSNIDAALEALANIGTGGVTTAAGTVSSGIGTVTVTFAGNRGRQPVATMTAASSLTGSGAAVSVAETTPGVAATGGRPAKGAMAIDVTNAKLYMNTGTALAPTWTVVGSQS